MPRGLREGAYAMGATKFEVVRKGVELLKDGFVLYFKFIVAEVKLAVQIILDVVNFFVGIFKAIWNTFGFGAYWVFRLLAVVWQVATAMAVGEVLAPRTISSSRI